VSGWLLVNPRSGDGSGVDELCSAAEARGIDTHVLRPGEDAGALSREAQTDVLGAAGGDGTVAAVAGAALESGLQFVCVPFGTRNHFARDVGLDRSEPAAVLDAFDGAEQRIDVGRANGRLFLNNVSIGAYAVLVHHGWRRVLDALRRRQRLTVDGETIHTRVLLVANNAYSFSGARKQLDGGLLHAYTAGGEIRVAQHLGVDARPASLGVAIDGERAELETPVRFEIEPRALRLLLPRRPGA
jgi:diacylglycerol kinase family enzyme